MEVHDRWIVARRLHSGRADGAGEDGEPFLARSSSPFMTPEHVRPPSTQRKAEVRSPYPQSLVCVPVSAVCENNWITCLLHPLGTPAWRTHLSRAGHKCWGAQHRPGSCIIQPTPAERITKGYKALLSEPRNPVSTQRTVSPRL